MIGVGLSRETEMFVHEMFSRFAKSAAVELISTKGQDLIGQDGRISRRHEISGFADVDNLGSPADRSRDDGNAGSRGLQSDIGQSFRK